MIFRDSLWCACECVYECVMRFQARCLSCIHCSNWVSCSSRILALHTQSLIFLQAVVDEKVGTLISFEVFAYQMIASD